MEKWPRTHHQSPHMRRRSILSNNPHDRIHQGIFFFGYFLRRVCALGLDPASGAKFLHTGSSELVTPRSSVRPRLPRIEPSCPTLTRLILTPFPLFACSTPSSFCSLHTTHHDARSKPLRRFCHRGHHHLYVRSHLLYQEGMQHASDRIVARGVP